MKRRTHFAQTLGAIVLAVTLLAPGRAASAQEGLTPLAPDGSAYGLTLAEWSAAWWQWIISIPKASNPLLDTTGQFAGVGQRLPVWFLGSTFGGSVTRTATIPAGQALFFGISASSYWEGDAPTEADWRALAKRDQDAVTVLEASVDGVPIPDLRRYRVATPTFTLTFPPGNVVDLAVTEGAYRPLRAIADGYYLLLPPLPAGPHVLRIRNELPLPDGSMFKADATYHLTVQAP
jgi:hypothetical protein